MATITHDTLDWYGFDEYGGSVHDVIGTRCDPYTHRLLSGHEYHHCCHSNLTRALAHRLARPKDEVEPAVHDVLNVFMCTGFTRDTGQYFMKASPVRPGDYLEFFAEIDLLGALSACPGGDCSAEHSSDVAVCHPLLVEVYRPKAPPAGMGLAGAQRLQPQARGLKRKRAPSEPFSSSHHFQRLDRRSREAVRRQIAHGLAREAHMQARLRRHQGAERRGRRLLRSRRTPWPPVRAAGLAFAAFGRSFGVEPGEPECRPGAAEATTTGRRSGRGGGSGC